MNNKIFDLADQLKAAKDKKKELDAQVKELGAEIERLDLALSDAMTESECERFSRNGTTFYLNTRLFASPMAGRKEDMFQALKSNGYAELVTETVNANTLASFVKEQKELNRSKRIKVYTETWLGRRRYLPNILSDNWGLKSFTERCSLNTPI